MDLRKTPQAKRTTYTWHFCIKGEISVIKADGETGVTDEDIQWLHRADDREVENNLKAIDPEYSMPRACQKEIREKRRLYGEAFTHDFKERNGFSPTAEQVRMATLQQYPKNYTASIDSLMDLGEDGDETGDKSSALAQTGYQPEDSCSPVILRLHEILDELSPRDREIYLRVQVCGEEQIRMSEEYGLSKGRISQLIRDIDQRVRTDNFLKKYYRAQ